MPILSYLLLSGTVIISGMAFFLFRKSNQQYLKLSLAFSGAYLFAITVLHLIPEVYSPKDEMVGIFILGGFIFQILLEFFSEGIEHGHIHVHKHDNHAFPLALMVSLCLHSFLEGMPLAGSLVNSSSGNQLIAGIILHHMPVSFALMSMLYALGIKVQNAILLLILFSLMAPAGALLSNLLSETVVMNISSYFNRIMGVVIGIFLHISTTILFESYEEHRFNMYKMIMILTGVGLAMIPLH